MSFSSLLPAPKKSSKLSSSNKELEQNQYNALKVQALISNSNKNDSSSILESSIANRVNFEDFVPLRQWDFDLEIPFPSGDEIASTTERTKAKLNSILLGKATKTNNTALEGKVFDPLMPNTKKNKKILAALPDEPQVPLFHKTDMPSTGLTKEEKDMWNIPSAISSWKNPAGFTVGLDKRLAMDARYSEKNMGPTEVSDKFSDLSSALETADKRARATLRLKAEAKKRLKEKEENIDNEKLKLLASRVKQNNMRKKIEKPSSSKNAIYSKLRQLAEREGRDVSEKVIMDVAKAQIAGEVQYDSRLYNLGARSSAKSSSDQVYDNPLFIQQDIESIYRPSLSKLDAEIVGHTKESIPEVTGPIQFTDAVTEVTEDEKK